MHVLARIEEEEEKGASFQTTLLVHKVVLLEEYFSSY